MNLEKKITNEMQSRLQEQNALYEKLVYPKLGTEELPEAYKHYRAELKGMDISAYYKCVKNIEALKETDPTEYEEWSSRFRAIPEYLAQRNNFNKKTKEILKMDGSPAERQAIWDTLDRNRTRAHNGVISLFNQMNRFATENKIAEPYPTDHPFDPKNAYDREHVAMVLSEHTTLLEVTDDYLAQDAKNENAGDYYRSLSLTELLKIAKEHLISITDENLPTLASPEVFPS